MMRVYALLFAVLCAHGAQTFDQLPTARNARGRVVQALTSCTQRTADIVAACDAAEVRWSIANVDPLTFGFFISPAGDNMVAVGAGGTALTSVDNPWTAADVGKYIHIAGAGAAGTVHVTTIASFVNAGSVVLTDAAVVAVVPTATSATGHAIWGTAPVFQLSTAPLHNQAGTSAYYSPLVTAADGTTPRSFAAWFGDSVNVKGWGATGDGVTDDTAALLNAIAEGKRSHRNVYFPAGTYAIAGTGVGDEVTFGILYISTTGLGIYGDGPALSTIKVTSATRSGVRFSGTTGSSCRNLSIDMNGGSGFGLYFGGQYGTCDNIDIKNIVATRANDAVIGGIALHVPGSTLCDFKNISVTNCANGIYLGFGGLPTQYINFTGFRCDPSTDGFTVRGKVSTAVTFNQAYIEGAPTALVDFDGSNSVTFNDLTGEIVGDYPLVSDSHMVFTNCRGVAFNNPYILYSTGAPAAKNIWAIDGNCSSFALNDAYVAIRESIGDVLKVSAGTPDQVTMDGVAVVPTVGGKTALSLAQGPFTTFSARRVSGANMKAAGSQIVIDNAECDCYMTVGGGRHVSATVGTAYKIYEGGVEVAGARSYSYMPDADMFRVSGGPLNVESIGFGGAGGSGIYYGGASPEGAVTAQRGSLYLRNTGTVGELWVKETGTGNTGWVKH